MFYGKKTDKILSLPLKSPIHISSSYLNFYFGMKVENDFSKLFYIFLPILIALVLNLVTGFRWL